MTDSIGKAFETLQAAIMSDPEYAWAWHCNLAVPITESVGVSLAKANEAAAFIMAQLFGVDITKHPHYKGKKSGAQQYYEARIADGG